LVWFPEKKKKKIKKGNLNLIFLLEQKPKKK